MERIRRLRLRPFVASGVILAALWMAWGYFFPRARPLELGEVVDSRQPETLVVVAPHSDDESLAAAGLIQQVQGRGGQVWVVIVTAGDAFRLAARVYLDRIHLTGQDMIRFGEARVQESRAALVTLGVPPDHVIFLGYPDHQLQRLWNECWEEAHPCRSPSTEASKVPYPDAFRPGAPYAGQALLTDLVTLFRRLRPDTVVFPHPNDVHVDHWAVHAFVTSALAELNVTDPGWKPVRERLYLVHRGDWPAPKGYLPTERLLPPTPLVGGMTAWKELPLTEEQVQRKYRAVTAYRTQVAVMRRYLLSFVRQNELFGALPPVALPPDPTGLSPWVTVATDPAGDTLAREVQPGADIEALLVRRQGDQLVVAARLRGRRALATRYEFQVRGLGSSGGWTPLVEATLVDDSSVEAQGLGGHVPAVVDTPAVADAPGTSTRAVAFPMAPLGHPVAVMISAQTEVSGIVVDRTAWRLVELTGTERT